MVVSAESVGLRLNSRSILSSCHTNVKAARAIKSPVPLPITVSLDPSILSVAPQHADHHALHLHPVGLKDARLHAAVGGLEADAVAGLLVVPLERGLLAVNEGDDLLAGLGRL